MIDLGESENVTAVFKCMELPGVIIFRNNFYIIIILKRIVFLKKELRFLKIPSEHFTMKIYHNYLSANLTISSTKAESKKAVQKRIVGPNIIKGPKGLNSFLKKRI